MIDIPVITVSSPRTKSGNTVLAINLAGALWNDRYTVGLFSSNITEAEEFLQKRSEFSDKKKIQIFKPKLIKNLDGIKDVTALIADISAGDYTENERFFNIAHTLITPLNRIDDISWKPDDKYLNFIWKVKKNQAADGIKYLNWIVLPYLKNNQTDFSAELIEQSKRFGFRLAPAIYYREEYMHIKNGYCSSDLRNENLSKMMTMNDLYARREILKLADFIWNKKTI